MVSVRLDLRLLSEMVATHEGQRYTVTNIEESSTTCA